MKNVWLDGIMGVIIGDALGCPVQFLERKLLIETPVTHMEGYGTYNKPEGTWTDDGSMTLASLESIVDCNGLDKEDTMDKFVEWLIDNKFTQHLTAFDQGITCSDAIFNYITNGDYKHCGKTGINANGNGALMRILPVCIYNVVAGVKDTKAINNIVGMARLTHDHEISHIGCCLYYFMVKEVMLNQKKSLEECMQTGIDRGFYYFDKVDRLKEHVALYGRLRNLEEFAKTEADNIKSTGYVVDTLEAAIWALLNGKSFKESLLLAVNLGDDADTVGAIAGGLAGLYYGMDGMPSEWVDTIYDADIVYELCEKANNLGACNV